MNSTVQALKEHRTQQAKEKLAFGEAWGADAEKDVIFTTNRGTYPRHSNLHRWHFRPLLAPAKLPEMRVYDLRHSIASILLVRRENPKVVQERLGPTNASMTLNTYSHVLAGIQEQATARLEEAFATA